MKPDQTGDKSPLSLLSLIDAAGALVSAVPPARRAQGRRKPGNSPADEVQVYRVPGLKQRHAYRTQFRHLRSVIDAHIQPYPSEEMVVVELRKGDPWFGPNAALAGVADLAVMEFIQRRHEAHKYCVACNGSGREVERRTIKRVPTYNENGNKTGHANDVRIVYGNQPCPRCDGTGWHNEEAHDEH